MKKEQKTPFDPFWVLSGGVFFQIHFKKTGDLTNMKHLHQLGTPIMNLRKDKNIIHPNISLQIKCIQNTGKINPTLIPRPNI